MSPTAKYRFCVSIAIFAAVVTMAQASSSAPLPTTHECYPGLSRYLVTKVMQSHGVSAPNLNATTLKRLVELFANEADITAVDSCVSADNLTGCLEIVCPLARTDGVEREAVMSVMVEAVEGRCAFPNATVSSPDDDEEEKVPWQKSVGYGTAFAAVVVAGSQFGGLLYPFRKHIAYKICLTYLIGLACGTLAGGGILHLMPASLDMHERGEGHGYVFKAAMILGGCYLFYWVERVLRDVSKWKKDRKTKDRQDRLEKIRESNKRLMSKVSAMDDDDEYDHPHKNRVSIDVPVKPGEGNGNVLSSDELLKELVDSNRNNAVAVAAVAAAAAAKLEKRQRLPSHSSRSQFEADTRHETGEVAPIAWILIMAKIFSTFIDGLSMGAAFTDTIPMGIKIGIAIICEEYPHELGDIAVLLNSGMNFRRALLWNFIAASAVFPGVYVGIVAGGSSDANPWIFAIAAGMFVYIALVDMIPELNNLGEELLNADINYFLVTLIQHLGLFSGFMLMFSMAIWGDNIGA